MEQRLRLVQGSARTEKRTAERRRMQVPGQIVWKDQRGHTQMASIVTRDVSEFGVSFECRTSVTVPLYRLVYFQVDRQVRHHPDLPPTLRKQNILSAVFRVGQSSETTGTPTEYALRLLIEPKTASATPAGNAWPTERERTRTA